MLPDFSVSTHVAFLIFVSSIHAWVLVTVTKIVFARGRAYFTNSVNFVDVSYFHLIFVLPPPTIDDEGIMFSGRPAVRPLTPNFAWRDISVVDGFQWDLPQLFIMWVGIAEKVFRVMSKVKVMYTHVWMLYNGKGIDYFDIICSVGLTFRRPTRFWSGIFTAINVCALKTAFVDI